MPLTMAEGMKVAQQWGRERGKVMIGQLQQKGTLDAQGRCPAAPAATAPQPASKSGHCVAVAARSWRQFRRG